MYNAIQLGYIIVSLVLTIAILIAAHFLIKTEKNKERFLKFWALATFVIHISVMWVNYLQDGSAVAPDSVLFPIYFCNAAMYTLMIVAFMKNKDGKLFKVLATFVAYAGTFGALITVFESHYFAGPNPDLTYGSIKSMLSHSTMMVGSLYLFVGGFVKIRVSNLFWFCVGLIGCLFIGIFINSLFAWCGLPSPNSMYLVKSAIDDVPLFTGYFIAAVMVVLITIFTVTWEFFALKKGNRWYNHMSLYFKNRKEIKE